MSTRTAFDVLDQVEHWDETTKAEVLPRLRKPVDYAFFSPEEVATGLVLVNALLDQDSIPVLAMIDQRLAACKTDGWRYEDLPEDGEAWRLTLALLEQESQERMGIPFRDLEGSALGELIDSIRTCDMWHGIKAKHVWVLWTRYACTAYYSHPHAWSEIGFGGPAYPRGYKRMGIGKREPREKGQ